MCVGRVTSPLPDIFDHLNTPFLPQALSDLSLVFRSAIVGSTGDVLDMYTSILQNRNSDPVSLVTHSFAFCGLRRRMT